VALYEQLASVAQALANAKRLELIELLAQGPRAVVELAEAAGLRVTTTSAQLQTFKRPGPVAPERARTIGSSAADPDVAALYAQALGVAAAHSAEVDAAARRHLGRDDGEHTDRDELLRRVRAGRAALIDVRPPTEYAAGHIPGAVSIPLAELAQRLDEPPEDREIVANCRGAYCVSHDAVRLLRARGRRAARLADGIVEWQAAGKPLSLPA
jgi:rhodanese-related sulfurtransferase